MTRHTLDAPIFFRIAEEHDKFVSGEGLQIIDGENFRESLLECLHLRLDALAKDRIQNFMNVFFHIVGIYRNILAIRLNKALVPKLRSCDKVAYA